MISNSSWIIRGACVALTVSGLVGCDPEFHPLQSTEMAFSIFGYLDPHADTQWIRVTPLRPSIFTSSEPIDAVVTLEDLGSGREIVMEQVLFAREAANFGDTIFAHNFITMEILDFSTTYRLTARNSGGEVSSAVVEIPSDLSHLPIEIQGASATFPMDEGDHVGMVRKLHFYPDTILVNGTRMRPMCRVPMFPEHVHSSNFAPGSQGFFSGGTGGSGLSARAPCPLLQVERSDLTIARSREPWPFSIDEDYKNFAVYTNIENGVGFLGGLAIARVSLSGCNHVAIVPGTVPPQTCTVYFGRNASMLTLKVFNSIPPGMGNLAFAPRAILQPDGMSWGRVGERASWNVKSPVTIRFLGYRPGRYRLLVENPYDGPLSEFAVYCEEREVDLVEGDQEVALEMVRVSDFPNEPVTANGCREG